MAILLIAPDRDMEPLQKQLLDEDPNIDVRIWPAVGKAEQINFAVCWNQPKHTLNQFPNLRAVSSLGAGVDQIVRDPSLADDVDVCRIVLPSINRQVSEYVASTLMMFLRRLDRYLLQHQQTKWQPLDHELTSDWTVGVMGLGELGQTAASYLVKLGFRVRGWARSKHQLEGVHVFAGPDEFDDFLDGLDALACLLPLTDETEGILDLDVFKQMNHPGVVINAARGEHMVDEDLVYAMDRGWIQSAALDVFRKEPLPDSHPFWNREQILVTPHIAGITPPDEAAAQIVDNYKRLISGQPLINVIDRKRGY